MESLFGAKPLSICSKPGHKIFRISAKIYKFRAKALGAELGIHRALKGVVAVRVPIGAVACKFLQANSPYP